MPLRPGRYELYCERQRDEQVEAPSAGWFGSLKQKFSTMLRAAEEGEEIAPGSTGVLAWLQARMMAWVAERVAEQRLLWNLRGRAEVHLAHPDDIAFDDVMVLVRHSLGGDFVRHRRWLVVDGVLLVASGALALVPGPNVLAYFFAFRVVGHWLSMRGASHGLQRTRWEGSPSPPLTALRAALVQGQAQRDAAVEGIAQELGLARLSTFVERMIRRP